MAPRKHTHSYSNASAFFVSLVVGACYGLQMSITSGILEEQPWIKYSAFIKGFLSSALLVGAAFGSFSGGFFSDHYGPKRVILVCSAAVTICSAITSAFNNIVVLIIFRTLGGLGVGAISSVGPVYVSEQSTPERRGMLSSLLQTSTTLFIVLAYVLNISFYQVHGGWRYEFALTALAPILFLIGGCFIPESREWLKKKRKEKSISNTGYHSQETTAPNEVCSINSDNTLTQHLNLNAEQSYAYYENESISSSQLEEEGQNNVKQVMNQQNDSNLFVAPTTTKTQYTQQSQSIPLGSTFSSVPSSETQLLSLNQRHSPAYSLDSQQLISPNSSIIPGSPDTQQASLSVLSDTTQMFPILSLPVKSNTITPQPKDTSNGLRNRTSSKISITADSLTSEQSLMSNNHINIHLTKADSPSFQCSFKQGNVKSIQQILPVEQSSAIQEEIEPTLHKPSTKLSDDVSFLFQNNSQPNNQSSTSSNVTQTTQTQIIRIDQSLNHNPPRPPPPRSFRFSMRQFIVGISASKRNLILRINAIIMYSPSILASMGLTDIKQQLIGTICVGLWNFTMTVFSIFLVDRLGRRPLLITGYSLMSLGNLLVVLSASITALQERKIAYWLSVPGLAIFLAGFEVGPGPLYFLIISELFPTLIRGRAVAFMTGINWACNIIIVFSYLPLVATLSIKWVYVGLSVFSLFTAVFVMINLKETKKQSLDEISAKSALKLDNLQMKG
ncbi:MAG: putative sugar porter family MFS transporter [Streblomastix strix]|uniref:Putative sugar porter family MFS transporter n=1 Tax=Streblomastix strix TaxID=222440 RepID=A0A5J4W0P6_9EUKA|nr:MAG: putative sugar porter family MFS transporter [Streblomastix strix]